MSVTDSKEKGESPLQQAHGVVETPLGPEQGCFKVKPHSALPRLAGALAEVAERTVESLVCLLELKSQAVYVSNVGPGPGSEVLNGLLPIP